MLIAIEGVDGVGKTTLALAMAKKLGGTYLKFPDRETLSGGEIAAVLRGEGAMTPAAFQALQLVNRLEKLDALRVAARHPGRHVVCDRYTESALVYGSLDGVPLEWLQSVVKTALPAADLQLLLTADPWMIDRERLTGRDRERYETGGPDTLEEAQRRFKVLWSTGVITERHGGDVQWREIPTGDKSTSQILSVAIEWFAGAQLSLTSLAARWRGECGNA